MFRDGEIDRIETRGEGGAEGVAIHEGNLGTHRLEFEKMLLWRNHVCQNLTMRLHDLRD